MQITRRSPVQSYLEALPRDPEPTNGLALFDANTLEKFRLKGPNARRWLTSIGVSLPGNLYDVRVLDSGAWVVQTYFDEFVFQSVTSDPIVGRIITALSEQTQGVYRCEHEGAVFRITGDRGSAVLLQTCAINFDESPVGKIVFTRVAGVTCAVIKEKVDGGTRYSLWVDYNMAPYLWEQLSEITRGAGGEIGVQTAGGT